ncbi:hypothetical protein BD414DRAFT_494397 [Trametes punicea]|nr:hypothetical protein BD414DRAFT_494397 [Trametes punicea]
MLYLAPVVICSFVPVGAGHLPRSARACTAFASEVRERHRPRSICLCVAMHLCQSVESRVAQKGSRRPKTAVALSRASRGGIAPSREMMTSTPCQWAPHRDLLTERHAVRDLSYNSAFRGPRTMARHGQQPPHHALRWFAPSTSVHRSGVVHADAACPVDFAVG